MGHKAVCEPVFIFVIDDACSVSRPTEQALLETRCRSSDTKPSADMWGHRRMGWDEGLTGAFWSLSRRKGGVSGRHFRDHSSPAAQYQTTPCFFTHIWGFPRCRLQWGLVESSLRVSGTSALHGRFPFLFLAQYLCYNSTWINIHRWIVNTFACKSSKHRVNEPRLM
jgi:hypothetical protein